LFIAFTPLEQPKIALAVIVENDSLASIVARKVLDAYYQLHPLKEAS
jgi:penicillin-binding protein 2